MIKNGILNPAVNSLISRIRHTNTLVISDRGFPYWTDIEIVDISLIDNVPTGLQVLKALRPNFVIGDIYMAEEFNQINTDTTRDALAEAIQDIDMHFEPMDDFLKRVPHAIGLIRTGDRTPYANMILVSA